MKPTIVFLFVLFGTAAFSQEKDIWKLHENYAFYIGNYYNIGWWTEDYYHIDEMRLRIEFPNDSSRNDYEFRGDSISGDGARELSFFYAFENLENLFLHPSFLSFPLDSLDESIDVISSADGKLINFRINEAHGGTYQSQVSYVMYNGTQVVHFADDIYEHDDSFEESDNYFNHDGYYDIDTIQTPKGIVYHLSGGVKGSSTCFGTYSDFVRFDNDTAKWLGGLNISARFNNADIQWDQSKKTLKLIFVEDDLSEGFSCDDSTDRSDEEGFDDSIVHVCVFKFTGEELILLSTSEKPYEPEDY